MQSDNESISEYILSLPLASNQQATNKCQYNRDREQAGGDNEGNSVNMRIVRQ